MQFFKGDANEVKMDSVVAEISENLSLQKDLLFEGLYTTFPLGEVIYNSQRSPLSKAIDFEIFRASFNEIFAGFTSAGSFESYISVFKKIFGNTATIEFTVPAPGKLNIDIVATEVELSNLAPRYIENNAYVFEDMITQGGDEIMLQTIKGFQSQYELEQMLFEMVPAGIFTDISLTIGA